ncbi:BTB/POZ domain-containing protein [Phanerochaete sordida]|uniref:BTB/POZ domain-containing protein n=1 Tax=Phanerochaete sordida TaxID=48140 RepID=A0A9P3GTS6_9APHY|nr:BTB/POZ domain-containing protein [Phanerochaete sordida]
MAAALEGTFRRDVRPTLSDTRARLRRCRGRGALCAGDALRPDVVLLLADREVGAHGAVLRARSPLFVAFFGERAWKARRWTCGGTLRVDLRHMRWREVPYVLRYLYGAEEEVFDAMEDVGSAVELVDAVFGAMAVANELLLDRMVLLCSRVIQQRITIANATSIIADASLFHATALVQSV